MTITNELSNTSNKMHTYLLLIYGDENKVKIIKRT